MVDGLDKLWESGEMPKEYEHMLKESVEVLTAIVVIWYQEHDQLEQEMESSHLEEKETQEVILEESPSSNHEVATPPTSWKDADMERSKMNTPPMRLSRAESMRRIREERGKLMNTRRRLQFKEGEEEEIQLEPKRVQQANTRRGKAL